MAAFYNKYRASLLKSVIGQETTVLSIKGSIKRNELPSAIAFLGPTSSGKTTLAYATAREILRTRDLTGSRYFSEINLSSNRSIDDIRSLISLSRLSVPAGIGHRVILLEEFQGILGNKDAGNALLATLERPSKHTIFLVTSMEPEKFQDSTIGKALLNRCTSYLLTPPTVADYKKYMHRIITEEDMSSYVTPEIKTLLVQNSASYRELASNLEKIYNFYQGASASSKEISVEDLLAVVESSVDADDEVAAKLAVALIEENFEASIKLISYVKNKVQFINKLSTILLYVMYSFAHGGKRVPGMWPSKSTKIALDMLKSSDKTHTLKQAGVCHSRLITMKLQAGAFAVDEMQTLAAAAFDICHYSRQ